MTETNDEQLFGKRFAKLVEGIDDESLCRLLRISRLTLYRWKEGKSAPHMIGRESVFKAVEEYKEKQND